VPAELKMDPIRTVMRVIK